MVEAVCKHVPYLDQLRHHVVWIGILFELVEVHSFLPSACILWLRLFLSLNMLGCTGDGGNMVMRQSSAIGSVCTSTQQTCTAASASSSTRMTTTWWSHNLCW